MHCLALFHLDALSTFGLCAVGLMLAFYAMESWSRSMTLFFAGACLLGSAYGFMQGAWPFGLVEGIWSIVAVRKWFGLRSNPVHPGKRPDEAVDAFLDDLLQVATRAGMTSYRFCDDNGEPVGFVQIYRPRLGRVMVHRVWAISTGKGTGTRIMKILCELADHHGVEIALRPLPFGTKPFPMEAEQLRQWYRRFGFGGPIKSMLRKPVSPLATSLSTQHDTLVSDANAV